MPLFDAQSVEQPLQLPTADALGLAILYRPLESAAFQSPVVEPEPIVIPSQYFQFVTLPIAENKPTVRKGIHFKYGTHQR
jgi:hypothetical protein